MVYELNKYFVSHMSPVSLALYRIYRHLVLLFHIYLNAIKLEEKPRAGKNLSTIFVFVPTFVAAFCGFNRV